MEARVDSVASQHLANEARLHALLTSLLAAVRSSDSSSVQSICQDIATWLTPLQAHPEVLGSELSYVESPLAAGVPEQGVVVTPAYQAGVAGMIPVVDDTRSAEEVEVCAEIQAKADELNGDPVAIYEYVKNNFELELYSGILKGAPDAYCQRSGSPADLAAVLIALYRASEIPARYVTGTILLEHERLVDLVGIDDEAEVLRALSASGIAHEPMNEGGHLAAVRMSHVWVEAYVPYGHYRGLPLQQASKEWIPLDPGIAGTARITRTPGALADPLGELGLSGQGIYDSYLSTVQSGLPLDVLKAEVESALAAQGQGVTYEQLLDTATATAEAFGALPATLPYHVYQVTGEYDFLPSEYIQKLEVMMRKDATVFLDEEIPVHQVVGHRTVLAYVPATPLDESVILSFGGQLQTPPYLASVVPVIRVDGKEVANGEAPIGLAQSHELVLEIHSAGFVRRIVNKGIAGNIYALSLGAPRNEFQEPEEYTAEDQESQAGILLSNVARSYVNAWTAGEEELSRLLGLTLIRPVPSEVLVSSKLEVLGDFGVPTSMEWRGVQVDADLRAATMVATRTGASSTAADDLRLLSGLHGSALEHQILTNAFQVEAISADKALAAARDAGISILSIDSANLAAQLPLLTADQAVVDDITERVNREQIVTVHAEPVSRQNWVGTGYIARNPETGESAYLLSGEVITSGGLTIVQPSNWPPELVEALSHAQRAPSASISEVQKGFLEIAGLRSITTMVGNYG